MKKPLHVLLIEDNENDAGLIIRQFDKSEYVVACTRVESAVEMQDALKNKHWDIVISDFSLPQFDAPSAFRILRSSGLDIPFIVVSGTIGEETAVEMMRMGAQDYLMKDKLARLIPAVTRELADARTRDEHKRSGIALIQSEERFRAVFENSVDSIGILLNGIHVFINPAYVILFGYTSFNELIGKSIIDLIAPAEKNRILDYIRRRQHDSLVPIEYDTTGLRKDGTSFDMEVRASLYDFDALPHTLIIIRDITIRKKTEAKLLEAIRMEEESNLMKSNLMMNMNHEIRTPMNAILGFSSLIINESEEDDTRHMAERIRASGNRLMKTLDDILELTQLQTGIESYELCEFDLEPELKTVIQGFSEFSRRKNLTIEFNSDGPFVASVNTSLFNKSMSELISNAIKFTNTGGVIIAMSSTGPEEKPEIEIRITDTGIGIAKEYHEIIFESFRQVSAGYGRMYEGTGLGLTIAKKIIELLNGELLVESEPGKGSVFIVRLPEIRYSKPVKPAEDKKRKIPAREDSKAAKKKQFLPRILIVEDNEDNIFVTKEFCRNFYLMDSAINGMKAIQMVKNNHYDVILMDINLGSGINGLEAAGEIRKIPGYDKIPIIALTGLTYRVDKRRLLSGGCDYYLGKPFSKSDLLKMIETALAI